MPDNLEKLRKLVEVANEDRPSTKEVVAMFQALIKVIKDTKAQLTRELADSKSEMSNSVLDALKDIKGAEKRILDASERASELIKKAEVGLTQADAKLEQSKEKFSIDTTAIAKQLQTEVNRVENMILAIPEADFTGVHRSIEELRGLIPEVPEFVSPEQHNLDVENLEEKIEDLEKDLKDVRSIRSSGGVIGFGRVAHIPMVDDFSSEVDGSKKEFFLSKEPRSLTTMEAHGSDFPYTLLINNGFTMSRKKLTIDAGNDAPTSGSIFFVRYHV